MIYKGLQSTFRIFVAVFTVWAAGCGNSNENSSEDSTKESLNEPYKIVCTIGMITDIVRNVAGGHAQVEGIIGERIPGIVHLVGVGKTRKARQKQVRPVPRGG